MYLGNQLSVKQGITISLIEVLRGRRGLELCNERRRDLTKLYVRLQGN